MLQESRQQTACTWATSAGMNKIDKCCVLFLLRAQSLYDHPSDGTPTPHEQGKSRTGEGRKQSSFGGYASFLSTFQNVREPEGVSKMQHASPQHFGRKHMRCNAPTQMAIAIQTKLKHAQPSAHERVRLAEIKAEDVTKRKNNNGCCVHKGDMVPTHAHTSYEADDPLFPIHLILHQPGSVLVLRHMQGHCTLRHGEI